MPRLAPLVAVPLVAAALAGCQLTDCTSSAWADVNVVPLGVSAPAAVDSVVVALVPVGGAERDAERVAVYHVLGESADDSVRVRLSLAAEAGLPQSAAAAVRGDTVWVRFGPAALVRLACSPPPLPGEVHDLRIDVPPGVALRSVVVVPPEDAPVARPAPAFIRA